MSDYTDNLYLHGYHMVKRSCEMCKFMEAFYEGERECRHPDNAFTYPNPEPDEEPHAPPIEQAAICRLFQKRTAHDLQ